MFIVALVSCLGNVAVIVAFSTSRRIRKNVRNLLITSLAFADLMVGCTVMPAMLATQIYNHGEPVNKTACDVIYVFHYIFTGVTFHHLMCITLERFLKITKPFLYRQHKSQRLAIGVLIVIWSTGFLSATMVYIKHDYYNVCDTMLFPKSIIAFHGLTGCVLLVVIAPMLILTACNIHLYVITDRARRSLQQQVRIVIRSDYSQTLLRCHSGPLSRLTKYPNNNHRERTVNPLPNPNLDDEIIDMGCFAFVQRGLGDQLTKSAIQHKTVLLTTLIILAMDGTWLPAAVAYFCVDGQMFGIRGTKFDYLHPWLGFVNSALNPIILAVMSDDHREIFKQIIYGRLVKNSRKASGVSDSSV